VLRPLDSMTAVLVAAQMRAVDRECVTSTAWNDDVIPWAAGLPHQRGESWALIEGDRPVAMGGARLLWPGVAATWMVATDALGARHARELLRAAWDMHTRLWIDGGVRRFETTCRVGWETAQRFLRHLGYEVEGRANRMGKRGEDYDLLARFGRLRHG
jgi:RimJ/RimL family protein N-acetyltransferase